MRRRVTTLSDGIRPTAVPTSAQALGNGDPPKAKHDSLPTPMHLALDFPPPTPPPLAPDPDAARVLGQVALPNDTQCGICEKPLFGPAGEVEETLMGLACTDPISHVFHASCLAQWRAESGPELAVLCPRCNVNPMQVIMRQTASRAVKTRIKQRRESCWRHVWAEWARQRVMLTMIMMGVVMGLITIQVIQDWIGSWAQR